jgi:hypothetical protein
MSELSSAPLQHSDEPTAVVVISSAFVDDPVERWLYPDDSYHREFPIPRSRTGPRKDRHRSLT